MNNSSWLELIMKLINVRLFIFFISIACLQKFLKFLWIIFKCLILFVFSFCIIITLFTFAIKLINLIIIK